MVLVIQTRRKRYISFMLHKINMILVWGVNMVKTVTFNVGIRRPDTQF